jgi:hypothetical protein
MIFPTIYVSVTLFVIPTLYGNDDLCKLAFQDVGLDDAFDCNTTGLTNLTKESGKCTYKWSCRYRSRIVHH